MKTDKCRGCGKEIIWAVSAQSRPAPFDAKPTTNFVLVEQIVNGRPMLLANPVHTYTSHFATCTMAKEFRKREAS